MSKRTRDVLILIVLAVVLIAAIVLINNNAPDTTGALRDAINR